MENGGGVDLEAQVGVWGCVCVWGGGGERLMARGKLRTAGHPQFYLLACYLLMYYLPL